MSDSTFVWYDLMTTDVAAAQQFYGKVVGWTTQPFEGGDQPYDMWVGARGPMGGSMPLPEMAQQNGAPPHWLSYIQVPDLDATMAKAQELGGQIHHTFEIPMVGRMAIVQDPTGGMVAVMQPAGDSPSKDGRAQTGECSWNEFMSSDLEAAWAFYSQLLGWVVTGEMDMGPMGIYRMYGPAGTDRSLGGFMKKPVEVPVSCWLYYFNVPDVDAAVDVVKANGGHVVHGPMDVPDGDRVVSCIDPQGAAFALHHFGG